MVCFLLVAGAAAAQSSKIIQEKQIKSQTVLEYFLEEGIDEPVIESIEQYNEQGELVELKEMTRRGEVKKWEKYVYDEDGNLTEELFLDVRGRVEEREVNIYQEGLRIEKQFYNNRDQMYKKKVYQYEYRE